MGHWLAPAGAAKQIGHVKRFDARLWTVNCPRPMMASVVTTGPNSLRVDCVFYRANDLAEQAADALTGPLTVEVVQLGTSAPSRPASLIFG